MERAKQYLEQAVETVVKWTGELLTPIQLSDWLQLSPKTLQKMRTKRTGPEFVKLSRNVCRYHKDAVQFWLDERTGSSTADFTNGAK